MIFLNYRMCQSRKGPLPPPEITTVGPTTTTKGNVVDVAEAAGNFKTLLRILSEVNQFNGSPRTSGHLKFARRPKTFVDFLKMEKEVTVFAPTDEAFAKLPKGTLESLTMQQKRDLVTRHFGYGVTVLAPDVITVNASVKTYGGESIHLSNIKGVIWISYTGNSIRVISQDVIASNGVIHVIDEVILPGNVVDVIGNWPWPNACNFTTLLKILSELEAPNLRSMTLVDILKMQRKVTIFPPTDEAFANLPEGTLESLTNEQKLAIVSRHFVPGVIIPRADIYSDGGTGPIKTFGGEFIEVLPDDLPIIPVMASNGVIHVVDKLMLPMPSTANL